MQKQLGRKLSLAVCLLSVLMLGSGCSPKPDQQNRLMGTF